MIKRGDRKFNKFSDEEIEINESLLWAVEHENISQVKFLLKRENAIRPNQFTVNKAFIISVYHGNISLISLFVDTVNENLSPEQTIIDRVYRECATDGVEIDIIILLEMVVSSEEFCLQQRLNTLTRKDRLYKTKTHYVVSFIEPDKLKEIDSRRAQHVKKLQSINRVNVFAAILSDQRWINGLFVDSVDSHLKLVVRRLLTLPHGSDSLRPDQTSINEAFIRCLSRGYFSMAEMLSDSGTVMVDGQFVVQRGVDQQGFDEALKMVSEIDSEEALHWLLRGSQGMTPSRDVMDEVYLQRSRRSAPAPDYWHERRRFVHRVNRATLERKARQEASVMNMTTMIAARASEEALALIARERRIAAARLAHFQRMQQVGGGEIHSYSDTTIQDAVLTGTDGVDAIHPPMDVDDDGGDGGEDGGEDVTPVAARRPNTLNGAVMEYVERRVGGIALTMEQITTRMTGLITETFPTVDQQTAAMHIVSEGMNAQNERILGLTLNFLSDERFPPSALRVWIQGFLVESIVVNSCNPGAMERIVTGLRGIDDPELNRIFTHAEGPNLARIFLMGTFNIYYSEHNQASRATARRNAMNLARELVSRGITAESSDVEAGAALTTYALEAMSGYGVGNSFTTEVQRTVETVTDMYDEFLLPFVREVLAEREQTTSSMSNEGSAEDEEGSSTSQPEMSLTV